MLNIVVVGGHTPVRLKYRYDSRFGWRQGNWFFCFGGSLVRCGVACRDLFSQSDEIVNHVVLFSWLSSGWDWGYSEVCRCDVPPSWTIIYPTEKYRYMPYRWSCFLLSFLASIYCRTIKLSLTKYPFNVGRLQTNLLCPQPNPSGMIVRSTISSRILEVVYQAAL